jgi:UDP-N-acetylglucosamine diphosphorylase / glucose-1-phosphate thymidylyltransferase / UDP-N-acetylgalactosamine diphosphorylase / glucosamine-1-phosphate N-acetyltransferase / galactosamine-1-phosphate N-acetyltransferase
MRAVILAGGESSRFWPFSGCHKSLLEIMGEPLVAKTINNLPQSVDEVIVVEPPDQCVSKALKEHKLNKEVRFRIQEKPRGMWDAILIGAADYGDDVLVASGHQFSRFAFDKLMGGTGTKLLLSKVSNPSEYGVAKVSGDSVVGINEKPRKPESDLIVDSIYRLSHKFVQELESSKGGGQYKFERVLSKYLDANPAGFEIIPKEEIPSLKYPWDALSVMERLLEELKPKVLGEVSEDASLKGDVFVDKGARVLEGAFVSGPAYIGRGAFVGTSALVRQSCVEMGSVVGFGSEVAKSLVGTNCSLHHSYVGDSVLGKDVWMGFGVITANRRFDKKQVVSTVKGKKCQTCRGHFGCAVGNGARVGIGSLVMPGVLIGGNTTIGPGTIVEENVKDNKKIFVVQKKVTR